MTMGPSVMSATSLIGDDVKNHSDEDLGDIKELMIDCESGRVAYAVVAFGGVFGIGEKLFAVPMSALTLDCDDKCFRLNATKDELKKAPGFDSSHWPDMANQKWGADIHSFYKADPYWA